MSKRTIHIERPDGKIPGLEELNEELSKRYGIRVYLDIDTRDPERFTLHRMGFEEKTDG